MTRNPSYKSNRPISPVGILVHSTGSVNPNLKRYVNSPDRLGRNQYGNHWDSINANKSVHAFIGKDKDGKIIVAQTLPYDRACWGAGAGSNGSANRNPHAYLQFEICQGSNTDSAYYWAAIKVAEEYCAYLCKRYGWTADKITCHKEAHDAGLASNHGDPVSWMRYFGDSMDKFRSRVAMLLNDSEMPVEPPRGSDVEIPVKDGGDDSVPISDTNTGIQNEKVVYDMKTIKKGSKGTQVRVLQWLLNSAGYDCGEIDGICGANTVAAIKAYQKKNGLDVDGICGRLTWAALLK